MLKLPYWGYKWTVGNNQINHWYILNLLITYFFNLMSASTLSMLQISYVSIMVCRIQHLTSIPSLFVHINIGYLNDFLKILPSSYRIFQIMHEYFLGPGYGIILLIYIFFIPLWIIIFFSAYLFIVICKRTIFLFHNN